MLENVSCFTYFTRNTKTSQWFSFRDEMLCFQGISRNPKVSKCRTESSRFVCLVLAAVKSSGSAWLITVIQRVWSPCWSPQLLHLPPSIWTLSLFLFSPAELPLRCEVSQTHICFIGTTGEEPVWLRQLEKTFWCFCLSLSIFYSSSSLHFTLRLFVLYSRRLHPPICFWIFTPALIIHPFWQLIWVQWPWVSLDHGSPTDLSVNWSEISAPTRSAW